MQPDCRAFKTARAMNTHLREEHGVMPYACEQCGKRFNMNSELAGHRRTSDCKVREKEGRAKNEVEFAEENDEVSLCVA